MNRITAFVKTLVVIVAMPTALLMACSGSRGYSFTGALEACSYEDVLLIASAAMDGGSHRVLDRDEAARIAAELSQSCRRALSADVVPLSLSVSAERDRVASRKIQSFLHFVSGKALREALRSFPITSAMDLADPKTRDKPALGAPRGTPIANLISARIIADPRLKKLIARGAAVGGDRGIDAVNVGDVGSAIPVRLVSLPAPLWTGGNFLIYLPQPYLVATSSSLHRELYPHDSSYVMEAMLAKPTRDGLATVQAMLEDFLYEIEQFGFVLNGNRGYYLTRSQNNNLPADVLEFVEAWQRFDREAALAWLNEKGLPLALGAYAYWMTPNGRVALGGGRGTANRWIAHGKGPCQEVWESHGAHKAYYYRVLDELVKLMIMPDDKRPAYARGFDIRRVVAVLDERARRHLEDAGIIEGSQGLIGRMYVLPAAASASGFDEPVVRGGDGRFYAFTPLYFANDRASRVSGYDSNWLYGPYNAFTGDFVSAALNVELYRHELDIARLYEYRGDLAQTRSWRDKAAARKKMILATMWDGDIGMLFDYDTHAAMRRTSYPFASSAYALWAGLFDVNDPNERTMAGRLVDFLAMHLEGPDGIYASAVVTGLHWDKPFCWPIHQGMIVRGLRRYAAALTGIDDVLAAEFARTADRIALKYLAANYRDWLRSAGKTVAEKVGPDRGVFTGYENGDNYTWNLAAVWDLYDGLSEEARQGFHVYVALLSYMTDR